MFHATGVTKSQLGRRGRAVIRRSGRQVLLLASDDHVFALANRCPHEGYPLGEGELGPGCVLTCDWHNWKFDLRSGKVLVGRDPVRIYPVDVRDDQIFVDLADPAPERRQIAAFSGLETALADNDRARMAREAARMELAGFDPAEALVHAIVHTHERLEGGMTHAHAAAADWLALADEARDQDLKLAALLQPLWRLAWDTLGAGRFPYPSEVRPWDEMAFAQAVESEDEGAALAVINGALEAGLDYLSLRPGLAAVALAHYADFGHSAIYVYKAGQLIERLGLRVQGPIVRALVRQLILARREERLPQFRGYAGALERWSGAGRTPLRAEDLAGVGVKAALNRLVAASGRPVPELYDALLGAAAFNLLHFDIRFDVAANRKIADNVSLLDFTHALTFANAVRHLCAERPDLWPAALLQLGLFVGRNRRYVTDADDLACWRVENAQAFVDQEKALLYDHGAPEPIIACHRVKVLAALEDELDAAPEAAWRATMCAGVNRYLNSPIKRHHGLRIARQARALAAALGG
jgi:nitrite reductase/ring-hydroxylating ferredoxin subunit